MVKYLVECQICGVIDTEPLRSIALKFLDAHKIWYPNHHVEVIEI